MSLKDRISNGEVKDLGDLLRLRVKMTPDAPAYRQFDPESDRWRTRQWKEIGQRVERCRAALYGSALEPGDRVAVMLNNSVEWVVFEQAAISAGYVVVPIYFRDTPGNAAYILGDSDSRLLLVGESLKWEQMIQHRDVFPSLETVVAIDGEPADSAGCRVFHYPDWMNRAEGDRGPAELDGDSLATIVYTSGTTGRPKGVMLSHRNILSNAVAISAAVPAYQGDVFLSFLPLSHMLERTGGYYYPMMTGSEVVFSRSFDLLAQDLVAVRPTVLISVPRVFERAYTRIEAEFAGRSVYVRKLFDLTQRIGWARFLWRQGRGDPPAWWQNALWPLLDRVVGRKILSRLGGRLRVTISAGGPLERRIAQCFLGLGLPVLQGYGLTETSPAVSGNLASDNVPESVGPPLPGVKIRLGENNELLVAGPCVMLGYWKRPDATREVIDPDGWLKTGDIAEIIDGKIYIRGRIKDILVTSTGEKVPRADLESAIGFDPLFEQVLVIGEGKPYLSALVVLNSDKWREWAEQLQVDPDNPDHLAGEAVRNAALAKIDTCLSEFPSYARVRAVHLTLDPWTVENELLTSTLKPRRRFIMQRYAGEIDELYAGHGVPVAC